MTSHCCLCTRFILTICAPFSLSSILYFTHWHDSLPQRAGPLPHAANVESETSWLQAWTPLPRKLLKRKPIPATWAGINSHQSPAMLFLCLSTPLMTLLPEGWWTPNLKPFNRNFMPGVNDIQGFRVPYRDLSSLVLCQCQQSCQGNNIRIVQCQLYQALAEEFVVVVVLNMWLEAVLFTFSFGIILNSFYFLNKSYLF